MDKFDLRKYVADRTLTSPTPSKAVNKRIPVREAKKSSFEAKLAEIEKEGQKVTMEAKIDAIAEMIETKNQRLSLVNEDENLSELIDKKKIKEMQKEIKLLEKTKLKLERLFEKMGGKKTEVVGEDTSDQVAADDVQDIEMENGVTEGDNTTYEEDDVYENLKTHNSLNEAKEKDLEDDSYEVDGTSVGSGKYEDEESEKQKVKENYSAFDGNPKVRQALDDISDATTILRKLGNEAYGGEKKNVYSSDAGGAFKAFDKALSDLDNALQSVDVKLS
jgi:hypothetical protein